MQRAAHQLLETPRGLRGSAWRCASSARRGSPGWAATSTTTGPAARARCARSSSCAAATPRTSSRWPCARGVTQYVVLGAGLDTFAYRNPHRAAARFEVDHPVDAGLEARPAEGAGHRHSALAQLRAGGFRDADARRRPEGRALSRRPAGVLFLARGHDLPQQGGGRRHAALHRGACLRAARWCSISRRRRARSASRNGPAGKGRRARGEGGRALDQLLQPRSAGGGAARIRAIRRRARSVRRK